MLLYEFIKDSGLTTSRSIAKRLIVTGRAVHVNGKLVEDMSAELKHGDIVALGTMIRRYKEK